VANYKIGTTTDTHMHNVHTYQNKQTVRTKRHNTVQLTNKSGKQLNRCALRYTVAYPGIFSGGGGGSTNSVEDRGQRERGSGGGSTLVRGSGGNCNLVQEISYAVYTLYLYSCSQHGSIYSGLYSCSVGYVREFLVFLHWLPLNLVILLRMYFPRNWEFGSALSKLRNLGGG
jgi:hypothetical protein